LDYLTTYTTLSLIRRGFAPGFINYKKWCTRLAVTCDKVYQLLAHGRWFSPCIPASSTTKFGRHDIAEILLKVALNTKNQIKSTMRLLFVEDAFDKEREWSSGNMTPTMVYGQASRSAVQIYGNLQQYTDCSIEVKQQLYNPMDSRTS